MDDHREPERRLALAPRFALTPASAANGRGPTFTVRDLLTIGFRHQRLVVTSFLVLASLASVLVLLRPAEYEGQMTILVKRERADSLVGPEAAAPLVSLPAVTEEELNSEVELLKSRDLLAQVVVATGIHERERSGLRARLEQIAGGEPAPEDPDRRVAHAVRQVARQLQVQPLRKSNLIHVSYAAADPALAATVLKALADRYLEKHLAMHRQPGALAFYEQEAARYGGELASVQDRLSQQNRDRGVVSVPAEREHALRLLGELEATEQNTSAQIAETTERVRAIEAQLASTPARTTTAVRLGSAGLLEQLYSTLVTQELKRIELLRTFQSTYPPVQDLEAQIAKVRAAIADAEHSPLREETTDRNPAHAYLVAELAKNRSELAGLRARATATARNLASYRSRARQLEDLGLEQQPLVRTAAQAEQNYLIYARKREEARASNALDAQRILNVAIAEAATIPFEPSGQPTWMLLLLGLFVAGFGSVALAGIADFLDQSFRTPQEVEAFLGTPVLAAFPRNGTKGRLTP